MCSETADGVARESKGVTSCPRAGCGRSACPVRCAGCGNGAMVEPLRHRQTKEAATDMFCLQPPRHISTLPFTTSASYSHVRSCSDRDCCADMPGWQSSAKTCREQVQQTAALFDHLVGA